MKHVQRIVMGPSRREVLGAAAAAAAVSIVPRHVLGGPNFVPPSEKVNIGLIGAGGQGRTNVRALTPLLYGHVNPYGIVRLDMRERLRIDQEALVG